MTSSYHLLNGTSPLIRPAGYHPWFTHLITLKPDLSKEEHYKALLSPKSEEEVEAFETLLPTLPDPRPLEVVVAEVRQNLQDFPTAMLGEVGLDKAFRIPYDYHADPRVLTPFTVPLHHQTAVLEAQLNLAVELRRNISLHSVKAPSETVALLNKMAFNYQDRWRAVSLDMHSCGVSPEMWRDIEVRNSLTSTRATLVTNLRTEETFKCLPFFVDSH